MSTVPSLQELSAAAARVITAFDAIPERPVAIADASDVGSETAREIVQRYDQNGFCVVELVADDPVPATLKALGASLRLGDPFIPPLYTMGASKPKPFSTISAGRNSGTSDADHPSFGRADCQRLHTDGTLQDIGFVKAGMLVCECAADEGGETILFDASAAYAELLALDPDAAVAMATPGTLVRTANINGCTDENRGPTVSVIDGALVSRYSVTDTDSWAVPDEVNEDDLRRGIKFLAEASEPGSPHYAEFKVATGQAIIFDNTRISHGRTAYRDTADQRRCMYRGLFLRHPSVA
ncbi:TauD/TfdA family dioxygenase [Micromonospora sp. DR5-3]|uniref:TauD/TfdA family dioxygenase n=1 Tax=unclassified Micromonospora TaxID=2617518 RepID=UPI0011D60934|nr:MULTISPECIES: TauD/TfdA family dioxygenase [unclassified Micromonospora]MCW3815789.1 TauD/TfdA family dioxygenase [Micromonospora sp. DR5-3]TYC21036.1 TauD/TfdA family dioxygenase [Micromonospora sp. MP36]